MVCVCVCVCVYIQCPPKVLEDKIALLAVKTVHLQIWLKDEYETKLQNVTFYYWMIQYIDVLSAKKFSTFRVSSPNLMWA